MRFKKSDLFYLGVPTITLVIYFIGNITTPRYFDGTQMFSPYFGLALIVFALYGMVMFFREIINRVGDDNDKRKYPRNMRMRR